MEERAIKFVERRDKRKVKQFVRENNLTFDEFVMILETVGLSLPVTVEHAGVNNFDNCMKWNDVTITLYWNSFVISNGNYKKKYFILDGKAVLKYKRLLKSDGCIVTEYKERDAVKKTLNYSLTISLESPGVVEREQRCTEELDEYLLNLTEEESTKIQDVFSKILEIMQFDFETFNNSDIYIRKELPGNEPLEIFIKEGATQKIALVSDEFIYRLNSDGSWKYIENSGFIMYFMHGQKAFATSQMTESVMEKCKVVEQSVNQLFESIRFEH